MLAVELEAQARVIGRPLTNRESLIRRIYDWEAGGHRPRDYYILFILVYASDEEMAARTIVPGSQLDRLMGALKMMGVPVNRRKFLLNSAAPLPSAWPASRRSLPTLKANSGLRGCSSTRAAWISEPSPTWVSRP
jgi:hypothetical protein